MSKFEKVIIGFMFTLLITITFGTLGYCLYLDYKRTSYKESPQIELLKEIQSLNDSLSNK